MSQICLIAAIAKNGVIGNKGKLPFSCPDDLAHFKRTTLGGVCIFGSATYEGLPVRPLPGRVNVVITRDPIFASETVLVFSSLSTVVMTECVRLYPEKTIFICGGASVYERALSLNLPDRLILSQVCSEPEGDVDFPKLDYSRWRPVSTVPHDGFSIETWDRVK